MSDIVERLRDPRDFSNYHTTRQLRDDAADEIERLRHIIKAYMKHVVDQEGVTFLEYDEKVAGLSADDLEVLRKLDKELFVDQRPA